MVTLFRVMRAHAGPLNDLIALYLAARADFERLKAMDPAHLTDLQRAARFVFLQRMAFGANVRGRVFGVDARNRARFRPSDVGAQLLAAGRRLEGVVIEQLPWLDFINRYDRPGALFYLDPPYFGTEDYYGPGMFGRGEFAVMAERLAQLKGRFILSLNDRPEVREIFAAFDIEAVQTHYGAGSGARPVGEVIISGGASTGVEQ